MRVNFPVFASCAAGRHYKTKRLKFFRNSFAPAIATLFKDPTKAVYVPATLPLFLPIYLTPIAEHAHSPNTTPILNPSWLPAFSTLTFFNFG